MFASTCPGKYIELQTYNERVRLMPLRSETVPLPTPSRSE